VSFSHGSNDGQKGVGLMMIILIAIVPARFSIDKTKDPSALRQHVEAMTLLASQVDTSDMKAGERSVYSDVKRNLDSLQVLTSRDPGLTHAHNSAIRREILLLAKHSADFDKIDNRHVTNAWMAGFKKEVRFVRTYTEYAPWWVIFLISVALGLGTTIGWKRIVVTIGEKIGKSHVNYAQGTVANLIAAGTISASSGLGLPVSTTHVLSSGIAGSMVSGKGLKNLQKKTVASIGIAWIITIPVTVLMAGLLFLFFRMIFG
jgi:PiT family inorganic phosphate transporter